jgi:hypothetical protein
VEYMTYYKEMMDFSWAEHKCSYWYGCLVGLKELHLYFADNIHEVTTEEEDNQSQLIKQYFRVC